MSFSREHFLLLFLKHIRITAVVSDHVIIAETPRPRPQLSAVMLLWYPVEIRGKQRHQTLEVRA